MPKEISPLSRSFLRILRILPEAKEDATGHARRAGLGRTAVPGRDREAAAGREDATVDREADLAESLTCVNFFQSVFF